MGTPNPNNCDFLDRVPVRLVESEPGPDDKIVLRIPKFRQRHAAKWLLPLLAKPAIRVHLDSNGSAVWKLIDGTNSIEEICGRILDEFGGDEADWADRVIRFVQRLEMEHFIELKSPGKS